MHATKAMTASRRTSFALRRVTNTLASLSGCRRGLTVTELRRCFRGTFEERQQVGVDLVRVGRRHAVRKARVDLERYFLQYFRGHETRGADRHNLIVVTMHYQHGDVDFFQVLGEVGFRESLDAVIVGFDTPQHSLQPPVLADTLRTLCARAVSAVKREGELL